MTGFFDKLLGRARVAGAAPPTPAQAAFQTALAFYPPRELPHVGLPSALTDPQVDENHAWFMRTRDDRIAGLLTLLADAGVDAAPLLDPAVDPAPAVAAVRTWLEASLPAGASPNAPEADYLGHPHIGARIFYAFAADLATLYGEAIVRRRPEFAWGVDRFRDTVGMAHHRRTALLRPPAGGWSATVLDLELDTLARLYAMRGGGPGVQPAVGALVCEVAAGALDPR